MVYLMRLYQQLKNSYHYCRSHVWRLYYGRPDRGLKIYGVTGTNGKTTTCIVLGNILREQYGFDAVGLLSTVYFWFGTREEINDTKMTTLDSREVFKRLRQMKEGGVKHVVLEVTSHALDQNRLAGVKLDGGIILNLSREHLDYHGDMESYAKAKAKIVIFLADGAPLVVNKEFSIFNPPAGGQFSKRVKVIQFSSEEIGSVETPLAGQWNKENVLAASKLARAIGIEEEVVRRGVGQVTAVPGRMEWVKLKSQITNSKSQTNHKLQITKPSNLPKVLIDYAVTPDALEGVYRYVRQNVSGKIFAVLGACGNRDRGKRPEMARVVAKYADELVLTREDPWTEDEEQIFRDLEKGLGEVGLTAVPPSASRSAPVELTPTAVGVDLNRRLRPGWRERATAVVTHKSRNRLSAVSDGEKSTDKEGGVKWRRIVDRREAIKYCLEKAGSDDVVVVTGKGAEVGMAIGEKVIPWSDRAVIEELLKDRLA